jgi:hypothetical protein
MSDQNIFEINIDPCIHVSIDGGGSSGIGGIASEEELKRLAFNISWSVFRHSQLMNSLFFQMEDGILDFFTDESYIDLVNSQNQVYTHWFDNVNYYQPSLVSYVPQDMVLRSVSIDSNGISGGARICILEENLENITLNVDLKAFVSRDNGNTFSQVMLTQEGSQSKNFMVLVGAIDLSSQPEDLHLVWKLESYGKNLRIYSIGLNWL